MKQNRFFSAGLITRVGVLSAIAVVLFMFVPSIRVIPPIYSLDFSAQPALLGGFALGPAAGVLVTLIKDVIGLLTTSTMGVGELADFLMSGSFVFAAAAIYRKNKTFRGALTGMLCGIVVMTVMGVLCNYFILIPFYVAVMNLSEQAIVGMIAATIPAVDSLGKLIALATAPFNLLKGTTICVLTMLMYKKLSPVLHVKK